ncbi:hypothetical protein [Nonomuraea dietziae]|uniref:hypothetical protein n=1 Tax=Nonomuraea dietziae TaxID=65515 RepID=UPI0033F4CAE4
MLAVIVEVQRAKDDDKRGSWPVYVATVWDRYGCPVVLLVLTPSDPVVKWAGEPIDMGPGSVVTPFAVGPELIPIVRDHSVAAAVPELAVLSALAHGAGPEGQDVLMALFVALCGLDDERAQIYSDYVVTALPEAARKHLEELVAVGTYEYKSDFARKHQAHGREIGRAEGLIEGKAEGIAEAVLRILAKRGVPIPPEAQERILACHDRDTVDAWLDRALDVTRVEELFA